MQCTTLDEPLTAVSHAGLATDAQLADLVVAHGSAVAVRVVLPGLAAPCGCGGPAGAVPSLVAIDPHDAAVPPAQRAAVRLVAPGLAVADVAWAFLAGGTVALAGLDAVVHRVAPLGTAGEPGPVLLAISDLAESLGRTAPEHLPLLRTVVVLRAGAGPVAVPGWETEPTRGDSVALTTGLGAAHVHPDRIVA